MLYGHGDNGYHSGGRLLADFSTNVWYGGEPSGLKEYVFEHWEHVRRYPEVLGESLAARAAHHHGLAPEKVLITSGAIESIYLLAQAFSRSRSAIVIPSFSEYEDACRMHAHELTFMPWHDLEKLISLDTLPGSRSQAAPLPDICWLGNPNNPTGAVITNMAPLLRRHPDTLFIVDEAFIEFTRSITSLAPLLNDHPNLVILRSLTKSFAIPGLRLGYTLASEKIIQQLRSVKMAWSVNTLALAAGHFIFDNYNTIGPPLDRLLLDKETFRQQLQALHMHTYESHTHYFLCESAQGPAQELQQYLMDEHRIAIRNAANFRGLRPGHFRLATLAPHQNQLLINALKEWRLQCA